MQELKGTRQQSAVIRTGRANLPAQPLEDVITESCEVRHQDIRQWRSSGTRVGNLGQVWTWVCA